MLSSIEINSIYLVALPIILGLILIETLISNILNLNVYKKADTFATIGLLTGNIIVSFLIKGTTLAFHIFLYQFKIFEVSAFAPLWFQWLITFVLIDFVFYFYHRCSHRSRFLWAIPVSYTHLRAHET